MMKHQGKKAYGSGESVLWPLGTLSKQRDPDQKDNLCLAYKGVNYSIQPYKALDWSKSSTSGALVPFWFVKTTNEENKVTMFLDKKELDGMVVPILVNKSPLPEKTHLLQASKDLLKKFALQPAAKRARGKQSA